jgi:aspartate/methionine/tyrosine aminotransferase
MFQLCPCIQVYEHLVFNGARHISLRSLPGMAQRTIRIGSAGE